ncbi:hypothetical protein SDC9_48295 [bioreactor metagenome]|uniref:Lipoprotein n=1 Tax=bioreactor metagenome TaxID=1076179 RepID=A0A644WE04_9ZZZZ
MKNPLIYLLLLIAFTSCDPALYGTMYVRNESDLDVQVQFKSHFSNADSVIIIIPDQTIELFNYNHLGHPKKIHCWCEFDTLKFSYVNDNDSIQTAVPVFWKVDDSRLKMWKNHEVDCYYIIRNPCIE